MLSAPQLAIVRFCAIECALQQSGEESVAWMLHAWSYAQGRRAKGLVLPSEEDVLVIGKLVEPMRNQRGYRQVGVRVGRDVMLDWERIPMQMSALVEALDSYDADTWFLMFEKVHPFVDGNGRSGQILFNWINDSLDSPAWASNHFNDPRRSDGRGEGKIGDT